MNTAAITRTAPQIDTRAAMSTDWLATAAANDDLASIEVIELDVVEIELRTGTVIIWEPM